MSVGKNDAINEKMNSWALTDEIVIDLDKSVKDKYSPGIFNIN